MQAMPKVGAGDQIPAKQWNQALRRKRVIAPLISRARVSERDVEEVAEKLNASLRFLLTAMPMLKNLVLGALSTHQRKIGLRIKEKNDSSTAQSTQ